MMSEKLQDRRRLIADYRKDYPAETAGLADQQVEALVFALGDCSTEALTAALAERGYLVALEVGGR